MCSRSFRRGMAASARERVGIIGWAYPEWRGTLYPPGTKPDRFLAEYARHFSVVEVASSFYRAPDEAQVDGWAASVPAGFELSLKAPEWVSRRPADPEAAAGLAALVERLAPLREAQKLGTIVLQFPATFKREKREADVRALVAALSEAKGARWAIEFRHESWWHADTYRLLADAGVTLVWSSIESGRTPPVVTSDRLYLRLFGDKSLQPPYGAKRRDKADEIAYWAKRVRDEGASAGRADIMMSKFLEGFAPASAASMCRMLGLPEPDLSPRDKVDQKPPTKKSPRQATLE